MAGGIESVSRNDRLQGPAILTAVGRAGLQVEGQLCQSVGGFVLLAGSLFDTACDQGAFETTRGESSVAERFPELRLELCCIGVSQCGVN